PVVRVAGGTAGAGRLRPLPELGADLACDGAAAGGPGRPAAVAAAGGGVRAGRLAVRPPDRTARVGRPCAEPGRHLPGQPEGAFAAARTAGLSRLRPGCDVVTVFSTAARAWLDHGRLR